jgi:long-chain acyl-CoA synthetase
MASSTAPEELKRNTKSIAELFLRRVADSPDREAFRYPVADEWRSMTWKQAGERARAIAGGLKALGLGREDRVAILSNTRIEWILIDLGIMLAGGATTTVYPSTTAEDTAFIISDSSSKFCIVEDAGQLKKLREHKASMPELAKVILMDGAAESGDGDWVLSLSALEDKGQAWLEKNPRGIEDIVAGIEPEHLATLIYTSGTTGKPKGVRLVHECWAYEADAMEAIGLAKPDDVQYLWLPMSHSFGKVLMALHLASGSVCAVDGRIPKIIENLNVIQPTLMAAAPRIFEKLYGRVLQGVKEAGGLKETMFHRALNVGKKVAALRLEGKEPGGLLKMRYGLAKKLVISKLKHRFGFDRVRYFVSGSAPLAREIAEFFLAFDLLILEGYGLTESSAASFVNRAEKFRFGTVGFPVPGTEVKLAPEDSEILMKGPGIMRGYHNLPDVTAETLTKDGWLRTGDIGEIDDQGFLRITDRKKDLIKTSGGKYIAPQSIEGKVKASCPFIANVVVHGDGRNFVSALFTLDEESIMKWAKEALPGKSYNEVCTAAETEAMIKPYIDQANQGLAKYETIKKFTILDRDLSVEQGEITPSLKVKRKTVEKKYKALLDKMYEGAVASAD